MKPFLQEKIAELFKLKFKFALTSLVATIVDNVLYLIFVYNFFTPVTSNILAFSLAVLLNFTLQKQFVFSLQRKFSKVFVLAMGVSLVGLTLSTSIIWKLSQFDFFNQYQVITKLTATGVVFFWNFYMKRYVFEKKFI